MKVNSINELKGLLRKAITIGAGQSNTVPGLTGGHRANAFLPSPLAATFIDIITEFNNFRKVFRAVPMNSAIRTIPKLLTGTEVYYQPSEATDGEETTFTAGQITLIAKKLFSWIEISEETFEDGIVDMRSMIRMIFARGMGNTEERAFLTGDVDHTPTTAVKANAVGNTWYTKDARLAFDGLVTIGRESGVTQTVNGAATVDVFGEAIYRMGLYAKRFNDLISFINPWSANQLMRDENLLTVDKYGQKATILNGEIGKIFGKWRLVNSDYVPAGVAVTTIKDNVIIGDRRKVKFAEGPEIKKDSYVWAISERVAMEVEYDDAVLYMHGFQTPSAS